MTHGQRSAWTRWDASGVPLLIARLILAYTFIKFGTAKLADPVLFLKLIRLYEIVPERPPYLLNGIAIVLPWLEIVTGTALLIGLQLRGAALTQVLMLIPFSAAILRRTFRIMEQTGQAFTQVKFDCGCGGGEEIIWQKTLTNLGLLLLAIYVLSSRTRRFTLERQFDLRQADSQYCHLCGYRSKNLTAGVCDDCTSAAKALPTLK